MYFSTIVLIPGYTERHEYYVKEAVNDLLIPYWKHLEASYDRQHCRCIGSLSMKDSDEYLKGFFKLEEVRGRIEDFGIVPEVRPNYFPVLEFMAKRRLEYFNEYCPYQYEPDPECPICGGTGYDTTYYNPNTKWDAYVIGGRFDGRIWGSERYNEKQDARISAKTSKIKNSSVYESNANEEFVPHFKDCDIDDNCRVVSEIPFDNVVYVPYALVTPDGKWYEERDYISPVNEHDINIDDIWDEMDKCSSPANKNNWNVDDKWYELLKREYSKSPTSLAVFLDCQRS